MKINFKVEKDILDVALRLSSLLGFEASDDGIDLYAVKGDKLGVSCKNGVATIFYVNKHHFYRELGVLIENLKKNDEFEIYEDSFFKTLGVMIDTSRGAVHSVKTIRTLIDYLAVIGYNMFMLYTEDTIKVDEYPYLGYMRGRYTEDELREIDDYAYAYGIEAIPCLECYGHMEKYLFWSVAGEIKDTPSVMMAREEKTFELVEAIIKKASSCFRSKRIHIGMDEAWNMGRGNFLTKHGFIPPIDIFNEYMTRLIEITNKYDLKPMMWSDMYFRANSPNDAYYDEEIQIPQSTLDIIPDEVQLVFWHYGEQPYCDDYMLKKHIETGKDVIFAGGLWSWIGHFPEHNYAFDATKFSLNACRNNGVKEMMSTVWFNDNAECDLFANLFGLSFSAELCYNKDASEDDLRTRFEACTGGNYDAFYEMSLYHNKFENETYENFHNRFLGKPLFWQDIMEGIYDTHLYEKPMSEHYRKCAEKMATYQDRWDFLYEYARVIFEYLAVKTEIAEKIVPAYKNNDKKTLSDICERLLPLLREKTVAVHKVHKSVWFRNNKVIGWANLDVRYAGMAARCDTAIELISAYLNGETDKIESLEEVRLHKDLGGFAHYSSMVTVNLKI